MANDTSTKGVKRPKGGVIAEINKKLAEKKKGEQFEETSDSELAKQEGRKGPVGVQQELIEDARQTKKLPAKLRNLLAPLCEAEETAGSSRLRATEILAEIQSFMAELEIPQVALPNGGSVIYTEKKSARYVAPKKAKKSGDEDSDGDESDREE